MKPAQITPGGPSDSPDVSTRHAFGARFAVRQVMAAKAERDQELADQYVGPVRLHVDRHIAELRRGLP